jgi:hypothetical protein
MSAIDSSFLQIENDTKPMYMRGEHLPTPTAAVRARAGHGRWTSWTWQDSQAPDQAARRAPATPEAVKSP